MKISQIILFILLAFVLVILDISLFSVFQVRGASLLLSFVFLLVWTLSSKDKSYLVFAGVILIFFTIFSSLSIPLLFVNFAAIPALIRFFQEKFFPMPTAITFVFYLLPATFIFDFVMMLMSGSINADGFVSIGCFMAINTIAGIILFGLFQMLRKSFILSEIKI